MIPIKDEVWINICNVLARQTTCVRKGVGCVLLDANGHVLSTGYNGVASGLPHCNEEVVDVVPYYNKDRGTIEPWRTMKLIKYPHACEGAKYDSGEGLGKCQAIHAEQNALLQCPDIMKIHTCYTTTSPCAEQCIKLLLNTSCQRIVFLEEYSKSAKDA